MLMCPLEVTFDVFRFIFFLIGFGQWWQAFFPIAHKVYRYRCKTFLGMRSSNVKD